AVPTPHRAPGRMRRELRSPPQRAATRNRPLHRLPGLLQRPIRAAQDRARRPRGWAGSGQWATTAAVATHRPPGTPSPPGTAGRLPAPTRLRSPDQGLRRAPVVDLSVLVPLRGYGAVVRQGEPDGVHETPRITVDGVVVARKTHHVHARNFPRR